MKYCLLGSTGLYVSRLALGTWTFTAGNRILPSVYKVDSCNANELVSRALDAGVNFFDTADAYAAGESESMLGAALKGRRSEVIIATKVGSRSGPSLNQSGLSRRHILWSVEQSLRRLQSDWIDVYLVHVQDPYTPLEDTLAALDQLVRAGKVRYLGFSNWSAWRVAAACEIQRSHGLAPFTHGQMFYSLLGRDVERDVIPMLQHYGLGLTVWSPLAGGFLTGKYTTENLHDTRHRMAGLDFLPFDKQAGFALVDRLRVIAAQHAASVAQVALAWLLARPAVCSVILGASASHQLEDNLGAMDVVLTQEELVELDECTRPDPAYPNWFNELAVDRPAMAPRFREQGEKA